MGESVRVELLRAIRDIATPVVIVGDDLVPLSAGLTDAGVYMITDACLAVMAARQPSREEFAEALDAFVKAAATDLLVHVAVQELDAQLDDEATAETSRSRMESVKALIDRALVEVDDAS